MNGRFLLLVTLLLLLTSCGLGERPVAPRGATPTPHPFLAEVEDQTDKAFSGEALFAEAEPTAVPEIVVETVKTNTEIQELVAEEDALRVPILMYHHISQTPENSIGSDFFVSPDVFREHMLYLAKNNYTAIDLAQLSDALTGETELPANPIVLTFDDGYQDNYEHAFPVLQELGLIGTFFVITSFVGEEDGYMNWDMLKEMAENGMRIESHTSSHADLRDRTEAELRQEIGDSQRAIAQKVGQVPAFLAYPKGHYDGSVVDILAEFSYEGAVKASSSWQDGYERPFEWPRLYVRHDMPLAEFSTLIDFSEQDVQARQVRANERLLAANIYHDVLDTNWTVSSSENSDFAVDDKNEFYLGKQAIAAKLSEPGETLFFHVSQETTDEYRRDQVYGLGFWLYSGTDEIAPDDLSITLLGSNRQPYWSTDDDSLDGQLVATYSETRLYGLDLERPLPPQTWIRIEVILDDLIYDPLYELGLVEDEDKARASDEDSEKDIVIDPDYEYVTGFAIKAENKLTQTIYIDEVQILLLAN